MPEAPDPFVIRGGIFANPEDVLEVVQEALDDGDGPVLSVYVGTVGFGEGHEEAVHRIATDGAIPHGKIRVASLDSLIGLGFDVVPDQSDGQPLCHHNVVFSTPPTLEEVRLFVGCFGQPIPNPARKTAS